MWFETEPVLPELNDLLPEENIANTSFWQLLCVTQLVQAALSKSDTRVPSMMPKSNQNINIFCVAG